MVSTSFEMRGTDRLAADEGDPVKKADAEETAGYKAARRNRDLCSEPYRRVRALSMYR
jgi:hypothetical protein